MIEIRVDQNTDEWFEVRKGIPTVSKFSKIMSASTCKRSKSFDEYARETGLASIGVKVDKWQGSEHTDRGTRLEPEAALLYSLLNCVDIRTAGFFYANEKREYGGSPDRLVIESGKKTRGAEIKTRICTKFAEEHERFDKNKPGVKQIPPANRGQIFGSLFVCNEIDEWDYFVYCPEMPERQHLQARVSRDCEEYQKWEEAFIPLMAEFLEACEYHANLQRSPEEVDKIRLCKMTQSIELSGFSGLEGHDG